MQFRLDAAGFYSALDCGFSAAGLSVLLDDTSRERLLMLADHLVTENEKFNLTAITDREGIIFRHFVDSATVISRIPKECSLLDVGCGAGFPSLVIAILRPDVQVTALDSTEKRVRYVEGAAKMLGLSNLSGLVARAEDGAAVSSPLRLRESFDVVTARAVARLPILAELCLPYVKIGGCFLAMKGREAPDEILDASFAIRQLGGELADSDAEALVSPAGESISRMTVAVRKVRSTPARFPRHFSQISKKPLLG